MDAERIREQDEGAGRVCNRDWCMLGKAGLLCMGGRRKLGYAVMRDGWCD